MALVAAAAGGAGARRAGVSALEYEMTYAETIDGPVGPTSGAPLGDRLCGR